MTEPATAAWDAPDGTRWVQTPGRDEWTGWVPGEDGCWLYSGDEFRHSYPQWEDAVLAVDGAPERVAAIERELRSTIDDRRMTDPNADIGMPDALTWHCWHCKWKGDHGGAVAHQADEPTHNVTRTHDTWHGHGPTDGT